MTDLIIILGSPASGKTTLARRLAADIAVPLLGKDDVKEALFEVFPVNDRSDSRRLSEAAFAVQLKLASVLLDADLSCLLEGNFAPRHTAAIARMPSAPRARIAQVWCRADPAVSAQRFRSRRRHTGHGDSSLPAGELERWCGTPPTYLEVGGPRWLYDSEDPAAYEPLLRAVKSWRV
jgi:predicted kinase